MGVESAARLHAPPLAPSTGPSMDPSTALPSILRLPSGQALPCQPPRDEIGALRGPANAEAWPGYDSQADLALPWPLAARTGMLLPHRIGYREWALMPNAGRQVERRAASGGPRHRLRFARSGRCGIIRPVAVARGSRQPWRSPPHYKPAHRQGATSTRHCAAGSSLDDGGVIQ